jgi:hypothetical protein
MNGRALVLCLCALGLPANLPAAQEAAVRVSVVSPVSEETIHDNTGRLLVSVAITNGDALAKGGAIRVLLDGRPHGVEARATSFAVEGVERGEHLLQVQVVDATGNVIASSESVKFYMWQASKLFPGRKN